MSSGLTWKGVTGEGALAGADPRAVTDPHAVADRHAVLDRHAVADRHVTWIGALPTICAVHCVVAPILVSTLPFVAATHALEGWLLSASAVLAVASLATSWRLHGRRAVWLVAVAGFAVWSASVAGWLEPLPEAATSPLGGLLVAGALFWNGRLRHQAACGPCSCPAHGD